MKNQTKKRARATAAQPSQSQTNKAATRRRAKSDVFDSVHQVVQGLHRLGFVDKKTMRSFDTACLIGPDEIFPEKIVEIREKANMSQPVFALCLGTTKSTVAKWESGEKKPSGPSKRLLEVVSRHGIEILTT